MSIYQKTLVECDLDGTTVVIRELHFSDDLVLGLFVWPGDWPWNFGYEEDLYRTGGYVLHAGPVSLCYWRRKK